jgi:acyl-CoA thioesterase-1
VTARRLGVLTTVVVLLLTCLGAPSTTALATTTLATTALATTSATPVTSCAARAAGVRPILAVVGASFSAGVGAGGTAQAWPAQLGRLLHLRVVVGAVPGAGYLSPGSGRRGPFTVLAGRLDLARLRPAIVLVQGGHNDIGYPAGALRRGVRTLIAGIHCQTPGSRVGIVSVFPTGATASPAARTTDQIIVAAARAADPQVLVFDPIAQRWHFPRVGDQLHPNPAGHRWIADRIAAGLADHLAGP